MRLFFALWPPARAASVLASWAADVLQLTGGSAMRTQNIHLTLAFLGEADPARAAAAAKRVRGASHSLPIDRAGYWKHNKIVWVAPATIPERLAALARDLQGALAAGGFVLEDRPFAAHVTLVRKAQAPEALPPLPRLEWPVDEFRLVRSSTSAKGATYEPVERFALH